VRFVWIPREKNKHADRLANEAMDAAAAGAVWKQDAAADFLEKAASAPNRLSGWQDAPSPPTTTLLLRHGQTVLSIEKRFSGSGDQPLTEVGRAQAAAAAVRLAGSGAVAVVSSPLRRARETSLLVAEGLGLEVAFDDDLRETDFGDWEGFTFREVREKWPRELDEWLGSTSVPPPFGESFDATAARVRAARDRVLSSYGGKTVVVVSHVTPIKTLLRMALDAPPSALYRIHLDLACLNEVQWHADGAAVVRSMNDTGHLSA
jgi:probable phosphoglycerate mutase